MTTFAIIAPESNPQLEKLKAAVARVFPDGTSFEFAPGQFVAVAPDATSEEIGRKLTPPDTPAILGQFVVFTVAGRWGYHRKDLWEWLNAKAA